MYAWAAGFFCGVISMEVMVESGVSCDSDGEGLRTACMGEAAKAEG
jgi:hypothetical protein